MAWVKIDDSKVNATWQCPECKEKIDISPDWYERNGTPTCCDEDMVYLYTTINVITTG